MPHVGIAPLSFRRGETSRNSHLGNLREHWRFMSARAGSRFLVWGLGSEVGLREQMGRLPKAGIPS